MTLKIKYLSYYMLLWSREKSIPIIVQEFLKLEHTGEENAIKKDKLLKEFIHLFNPNMKDRHMRELYKRVDKCWCEDGLYYPRQQEIQREIDKLDRTIIHFVKKKLSLQFLKTKMQGIQGRLF